MKVQTDRIAELEAELAKQQAAAAEMKDEWDAMLATMRAKGDESEAAEAALTPISRRA